MVTENWNLTSPTCARPCDDGTFILNSLKLILLILTLILTWILISIKISILIWGSFWETYRHHRVLRTLGGQILIFWGHLIHMTHMVHLPHRSHLPVGRLCRNLVKKTKVPTYLPLPEGKKLRRKSKVPTYLPLWKGQKVGQNTKVPTYFSIWRVKKTRFFAQREKWITKTSVFFPRGVQVGANEKKKFFFRHFRFPPLVGFFEN